MWEQIRAGVAAELLSRTARDEHSGAGTPDSEPVTLHEVIMMPRKKISYQKS